VVADNIHHIAPYLPFYTYSRVWFENKKELLALGTREIPLFSTVGLHWPKAHAS
jgi:fatty acid desaturase